MITVFLLFDGRQDDESFEMMKAEGAFPRLVELIQDQSILTDSNLHQMLLELLYEMSRIQRMTWEDIGRPEECALAGKSTNFCGSVC